MYVARKDRTNASALFVSLSAVGMALGPLLALPLAQVPEFQLGELHATADSLYKHASVTRFSCCAYIKGHIRSRQACL